MNWTTIYIKGKKGFQEEVLDILVHSRLKIMPGSAGAEQDVCLLWIDENLDLRTLKKAIGSKNIFKYRLQFYRDFDEIQKGNKAANQFTEEENSRIREMNLWDANQKYKHSA